MPLRKQPLAAGVIAAAVLGDPQIGRGEFCDIAERIQHHRFVEAARAGFGRGTAGLRIKADGLGIGRRRFRRGPAPFRDHAHWHPIGSGIGVSTTEMQMRVLAGSGAIQPSSDHMKGRI